MDIVIVPGYILVQHLKRKGVFSLFAVHYGHAISEGKAYVRLAYILEFDFYVISVIKIPEEHIGKLQCKIVWMFNFGIAAYAHKFIIQPFFSEQAVFIVFGEIRAETPMRITLTVAI